MRNNKKLRGKAVSVFLVLLLVLGTVFAGTLSAAKVRAEETEGEAYSYYVFIYSGKEGYFGNPETRVIKEGPFAYGTPYSVSLSSLGLVLENEDQYYARGLKLAGHDNDEIGKGMIQSYTFPRGIVEDVSLSVAYGMAGGMVRYTVNYIEAGTGAEVYPSETYYGMVGDKPVVSYQYAEGYRPNAYNLGKTLVEDESKNVFTFTYTKLAEGEVQEVPEGGGDDSVTTIVTVTELETVPGGGTAQEGAAGGNEGTPGGNEGAAGNTGEGTAGESQSATETQSAETEPQDYIDLDDEEIPLSDIDLGDDEADDAKPPVPVKDAVNEGISLMTILPWILLAIAAVFVLFLLFFLKRRKKEKK